MPYKTIQADAQLFVRHKDVSVFHTYENDDVADGIHDYYYVLDETLCEDESFDIRELKAWEPEPSYTGMQLHEINPARLKHMKKVLIKAIDSGELKPYEPRE